MVQFGSIRALGARGRRFKSCLPDVIKVRILERYIMIDKTCKGLTGEYPSEIYTRIHNVGEIQKHLLKSYKFYDGSDLIDGHKWPPVRALNIQVILVV